MALWEAIAASGSLYRRCSFRSIRSRGVGRLIADPRFWFNLSVTGIEIGSAIAIGGGPALLVGLVLGGNRFLGAAFEPYLAALAATPKIIVLPIVYFMLGVGPASKIAIGASPASFR